MLIYQDFGADFCVPKSGYQSQKYPVLPLDHYQIGTKRLSEDKEFMFKFSFGEPALPVVDVMALQYISYIYDHSSWIGL